MHTIYCVYIDAAVKWRYSFNQFVLISTVLAQYSVRKKRRSKMVANKIKKKWKTWKEKYTQINLE